VTITIREVARAAEVSVSTVSRAFTAPDLVNETTRQRVLATAEELGYRPNRAARGLITGRTGNIGVLIPDLANPFFHGILQGVQDRARTADHWVFLADSGEDPRAEYELILQMAKQVEGIVVCSSRMTALQLEQVVGVTSLVFLNRRVAGVPSVLMDSGGGGQQAVDHLAALGHRRVAYLSGPRNSWSNKERRRGLRTAARRVGMDVLELGPFTPGFDAGVQGADLAVAAGVTAIIAYNDLMALGVLSRLADRDIPVPASVSVLGFDDIPLAAMTVPSLTTVAVPKEAAGRAAVDLLLGLLVTGTGGEARTELPTQLIVRASTAPPPPGTANQSPRRPVR
jgi:DNA-binding LacI/PurR family transcriptional regulator